MPGGSRPSFVSHPPDRSRGAVIVTLVLLLLSALPLVPGVAPTAMAQGEPTENILIYPGFERSYPERGLGDRPIYWDPYPAVEPSGVEMGQASDHHHNGSYSALIKVLSDSVPGGGEVQWRQERGVEPGSALPVGGWVRTDLGEDTKVVLRAKVYNGAHRVIQEVEVNTSEDHSSWVELRAEELVVDEAGVRARLECVLAGEGRVWFDDVYLGTPTDMDNAPLVVSVPPLEAAVGEMYTYRARGVDLEGDTVTFSLVSGPDGMSVTPEGWLTWTPDSVPDGAVRVVLRARDDADHFSHQDFFVRVLTEPAPRPVHVYLYSTFDDHVNEPLSAERYEKLMPVIEDLWQEHPELRPSVSVLANGADATHVSDQYLSTIVQAISEGWAEVGYTGFHEPTYDNNALYGYSSPNAVWENVVEYLDILLSRARDPLTGELLTDGEGGLLAVERALGEPMVVAGIGQDGPQLHALSRYDQSSVLLDVEDGPFVLKPQYEDPNWGILVDMLSEDPSAPRGAYWEGGYLRLGFEDAGVPTLSARGETEWIDTYVSNLDWRRVNIVPIKVMDRFIYCNGSAMVDGEAVHSPTEWAYANPSSPSLPAEAIIPLAEREAAYAATCATLDWLAEDLLPSTGGRFVSNSGMLSMVDPGTGLDVPASELAAAASDLISRRRGLEYPNWVGVSWGYCQGDFRYFSLDDMYGMLIQALAAYSDDGALPASMGLVQAHGPREGGAPAMPWQQVPIRAVLQEATRQAELFGGGEWSRTPSDVAPSVVDLGDTETNAMEFLLLMAETYLVLHEEVGDERTVVNLFPTLPWPLTLSALQLEGELFDVADSWALKPASTNLQTDDEAPQVRYVSPAPGAVNVTLDSILSVAFSERMDEARDPSTGVTVDPPLVGEVLWRYHRLVFEPSSGLLDNTTYTVTLGRTLTDAAGNPLASEVSWSFTTLGLDNGIPSLVPWPEDIDVEVLENQTVRLSVAARDDGPPPLMYSWRLDGVTVGGEEADSFSYTPSYLEAGNHTVTVVVSDSAGPPGVATFTWNVTVVNVNLRPELVSSVPDQGIVELVETEEGLTVFRVEAKDPDEGYLRYSWLLDGLPVPEGDLSEEGAVYSYRFNFTSAGNHTLVCAVTDRAGVGFDLEWTVAVADVNRPPIVNGISPDFPPVVEIGDVVLVTVNASDPDGDTLAFEWWVDGVAQRSTLAPEWNFTTTEEGAFTIVVNVTDGSGGIVPATTTVHVLPFVEPPDGLMTPDNALPWLIVLLVVAAIVVAIMWPKLRRKLV